MSSYLQQQIQTRREAKRLSIYALERQAGLKRNAARNILHGLSKKPSADSLKAIANVLECTVDDLVGPVNENYPIPTMLKTSTPSRGHHIWNKNLYIDTIELVSENMANKNLDLKLEQVIALISEAYKYSLAKETDKADQDFVKWLINKNC